MPPGIFRLWAPKCGVSQVKHRVWPEGGICVVPNPNIKYSCIVHIDRVIGGSATGEHPKVPPMETPPDRAPIWAMTLLTLYGTIHGDNFHTTATGI